MKAVLLHNEVLHDAPRDQLDTLVQAKAVADALVASGHEVDTLAVSLDLAEAAQRLLKLKPDFVFNLVEGIGGSNKAHFLAPLLLELAGIPYTGNSSDTLFLTTNKVLTKQLLLSRGIPTPRWVSLYDGTSVNKDDVVLIKPVFEDASVGLHEDQLLFARGSDDLRAVLGTKSLEFGGDLFAEQYIDGREFNLSLIGDQGKRPVLLPPAEIRFVGYPSDKPKVVGFKAKWDTQSFELMNTPRHFDFPESDSRLIEALREIAVRSWEVCGLGGYARVDFRVDNCGNPYVLEINSNPCISEDSGFVAAAAKMGLNYQQTIEAIAQHLSRPTQQCSILT
jgi:D-alanine-D-alanine ligase